MPSSPPSTKVDISLRLPRTMLDRARAAAADRGLFSTSEYIRQAVAEALRKDGRSSARPD